jgi:predicted ATPase
VQLLIKGIRSFSPNNQHVIEFYKPLTLIVGQNGAGKTVQYLSNSRFMPDLGDARQHFLTTAVRFADHC